MDYISQLKVGLNRGCPGERDSQKSCDSFRKQIPLVAYCPAHGFWFDFTRGQYTQCECQDGIFRIVAMTCAITSLFIIDRLEYQIFGAETPVRAAIIFFITHVLLYEVLFVLALLFRERNQAEADQAVRDAKRLAANGCGFETGSLVG